MLQKYRCEHCGREWSMRKNFGEHEFAQQKPTVTFSCKKCPEIAPFASKADYDRHLGGVHNTGAYQRTNCFDCGKNMFTKSIVNHCLTVHKIAADVTRAKYNITVRPQRN